PLSRGADPHAADRDAGRHAQPGAGTAGDDHLLCPLRDRVRPAAAGTGRPAVAAEPDRPGAEPVSDTAGDGPGLDAVLRTGPAAVCRGPLRNPRRPAG